MAVAAIVGSPATTKVAAEPLFPPAVLPVSLYAAVAEACRQVEAADTPATVAVAHATLDRLSERQQQATRAWLLPAENCSELLGRLGDLCDTPDGVLIPFERLTRRLRWQLVTTCSADDSLSEASQRQLRAAIESRETSRLWQLARDTADSVMLCETLLAAGDLAAENGWETAAINAWQDAATFARRLPGDRICREVAARERLRPCERLDGRDVVLPRSPCDRLLFEPMWTQRLPFDQASDTPAAVAVASFASRTAGPLLCWHANGGLHARGLHTGEPPWQGLAERLFPPRGDTLVSTPSWAPSVFDGRLLSVLMPTAAAGSTLPAAGSVPPPQLICLDLTDAAQGRMLWSLPLPDAARFVTRPICARRSTGEAIAWMMLGASGSELAAVRLHDGELLWRRPLGLPLADRRSADDEPDSVSVPAASIVVCEDLVIATLSDGSVWAVNHDGELVWGREPVEVGDVTAASRGFGQASVCCDALVLRGPSDHDLTALDLRSGSVRWQFTAAAAVTLLGSTGGRVFASHPTVDDPHPATTLVMLSCDDGGVQTVEASLPHPWGEPLLAGDAVFWPVQRSPTESAILVLAAGTLSECESPMVLESDVQAPCLAAGRGRLIVSGRSSIQVFGTPADD